MSVLDIVLCGFLIYGFIRGLWNGLFVELASLISLILGIYVALKFSFIIRGMLESHVSWSPKTTQIIAFTLTFVLVVVVVYVLAKFFTAIANFASLGLLNKVAGGFFGILKMVLIISVTLNIFQKINSRNTFAEKATLDKSIFYNPILKVAAFIYPSLEEWGTEIKKQLQ